MKTIQKITLIINTLKYLKFIQIYFRLFYFTRTKIRKLYFFKYKLIKTSICSPLKFDIFLENKYSNYYKNEFSLLNLKMKFEKRIDWNYSKHGKLWTYNLTYFEYLKERNHITLIYDFINDIENIKDGLEPFPISLRGINWIKFISKNHINNKKINDSLYAQYYILLDNLEYHILGNHLLENGFSLLFGSYYFNDEKLYQKAKNILENELNEQILEDGSHFELSPMYHKLMLLRVLDCINLVKNNNYKNHELENFLREKASIMLAWLKVITFKNGDIPLLNDSTNAIAPTSEELFLYAKLLNIKQSIIKLTESGYRKIENINYECIIDIGHIGASYIPGHAHSDTFNFVIQKNNKPFIVDTGLSTYEINTRRIVERSTYSHNTVEINNKSQSEIWGGFRLANRARIIYINEGNSIVEAIHDGYKKQNIFHTRKWIFKDNFIIIEDSLNRRATATARIHFHPNITKEEILRSIETNSQINFIKYNYAYEFNKIKNAIAIEIKFIQFLKIKIILKGE